MPGESQRITISIPKPAKDKDGNNLSKPNEEYFILFSFKTKMINLSCRAAQK